MATEPSRIIIGDTLNWVRDYNTLIYKDKDGNSVSCPASTYTLTYYFAGPEDAFSLTGSATNDNFEISAAATLTEKWNAGTYNWIARVSHSTAGITKKYQVDEGIVELIEDPAKLVQGFDGRSHVKKVLDGLEMAIEGRAGKATLDWISYSISGRARAIDPKELRNWYSQYKWLYAKEKAELKIGNEEESGERILIEFSKSI